MPRRIPARDETVVFVTDDGQVAIEQRDSLGNDPAVIHLDPSDIPTVVKWLEECATDAAEIRDMKSRDAMSEQVVPKSGVGTKPRLMETTRTARTEKDGLE